MSKKTMTDKQKVNYQILIIICLLLVVLGILFTLFMNNLNVIHTTVNFNLIAASILIAMFLILPVVYFWRKAMTDSQKNSSFAEIKEIEDKITIIINTSSEKGIKVIEESKQQIQEQIKKLVRQDYTLTSEFQKNTEETEKLNKQLVETQKLINDSLNSQLQEMKLLSTELMDQRQENGNLQREIEKWQEFAVTFLEYIERTLEMLVDNTSKQTMDKVITDFEKLVNPLGLERVIPLPGSTLSEELHLPIAEKESQNVPEGTVLECKKWGYKINGKLHKDKRAEVIVAKKPENLQTNKVQDHDQLDKSKKKQPSISTGLENTQQITTTEQNSIKSESKNDNTPVEDITNNLNAKGQTSTVETSESGINTNNSDLNLTESKTDK